MSEPYNLTIEEAINAIEKNMPLAGTYTVLTEALHMAIRALKKDIAIEPTCEWSNDSTIWQCPTCQSRIYCSEDKCLTCGQEIEWEKLFNNFRFCPNCYKEVHVLPEGDHYEATCEGCGIYAEGPTYEDAVNAWNRVSELFENMKD